VDHGTRALIIGDEARGVVRLSEMIAYLAAGRGSPNSDPALPMLNF